MNSNNPLAVEPETENDAAYEIDLSPFRISLRKISLELQRRLARQREGFPKMINTLKHECAARNRHIHGGDTGLFASSHRCTTQRHPVRMPRRLSGPLRQHSAGRRGVAAMPAEEHVEPLIRLPERGARGRTGGGAEGGERRRRQRPRPVPLRPLLPLPQPRSPQPRLRQRPQRLRRARQPASPAMRRLPRSAAPAAPTIRRSAPACRPAAHRHCNAWKRTRRRCRRPARRPSTRPVAAPRLRRRRGGDREPGSGPRRCARDGHVLRPMRPREELFVLRSACSGDVRTLCGGVAPGGGRIMQCLATQAALDFAGMQGSAGPVRSAIN